MKHGFNAADNPYTSSEYFKIFDDYGVPMRYSGEQFFWSYLFSVHWPNDCIGSDSMTRWIIEKSVGFSDVGLFRISESVRKYAYLELSSHASARSSMVANIVSALTAQLLFSVISSI